MADLHRGTRRYDLHLSGPQVVGIVVGSLVTLGLAFGIGVGFGRRLATAEAPIKVGPEPVAAPTPASPDAGHHDYTYDAVLTGADTPTPSAPPKPMPPKATTATIAVPPSEPVAPAVDGGTPGVIIGAPRTVTPPAAAPPPPPEPPAPVAHAAPPPPAPVAHAAPPEPKQAKPDETTDRFTVQFTATANQADAERLAKQLKAVGYAPAVVAADVPGKGRLYRVRAGHFPTREAAEAFREQVQAKHKFAGMVMSTR